MIFPFDKDTFNSAIENGNLNNMKWLLENGFPHDNSIYIITHLKMKIQKLRNGYLKMIFLMIISYRIN